MTRRAGTSLMEVLVTLGILGIGLTSVIGLFPLAAITTGQALKDDRTTACARTADGFIRDYHHRFVVEVGPSSTEAYFAAMDNGPGGVPPINANSSEPSYPVVIDPMGFYARSGAAQSRMGDAGTTFVARRNLSIVTSNLMALRLFSQLDGLSYDANGAVQQSFDMRDIRYTWLMWVQRPSNRDRFNCTLQVVVFDNRKHLYAPPGSEAVYGPATNTPVTFTPTRTAITGVPASAAVRKGSWIFDVTHDTSGANRIRHMNAYRVVSVTDMPGNTYALELHTPVRRVDGLTGAYTGTVLVMPGVCDVFERPALTGSTGP